MTASKTEMKQINVCRFLAEALDEQLDTFTVDDEEDPELMEGVVQIELLDFSSLLEHLKTNYEESGSAIDAMNTFKAATKGECNVFAYWEA